MISMRNFIFCPFIVLIPLVLSFWGCGQTPSYDGEKIDVHQPEISQVLMDAGQLYEYDWNTLPQILFWKKVMLLSPDSCFVNIASSRKILETGSFLAWQLQTEEEKKRYKDNLRKIHHLDSTEQIFVTSGKNRFYHFQDIYPSLAHGIELFERYGVDPWYAQTILLIESPSKIQKSPAGAHGHFQIMPSVARKFGLKINDSIDERTNFDRAAYAASQLIQKTCIPEAQKMLERYHLSYKLDDLWFRLLVLHIYHAGAQNVNAAIDKLQPTKNGQELITGLWLTTAANFKNSSQNYSQVALAALLILDDMIHQKCTAIYPCIATTE